MAARSITLQLRLQAAAALELRRRERMRALGTTDQEQLPPWATDFAKPSRYKVAYGGRGSAKCLGLGTPILMHDGTLRAVEDVAVGDLVMGPDSQPRRVLDTITGESELFAVRQTSAMTYVVNQEHILSLKKSASCQNDVGKIFASGNPRRPNGRYPDWSPITNIRMTDYLAQSERWKANFRGYRAGVIHFPERDVPVDPYLMGVWLGDGDSNRLTITSADDEIALWLKEFSAKHDLNFVSDPKPNNKASRYFLYKSVNVSCRTHSVWKEFRALNVVRNKHIPQIYLANDEQTRLSLLAGLIDTDGTFDKRGTYNITLANERLAQDVKRLADGLGFRASYVNKPTICTNNGARGQSWRIGIGGDLHRIPCLIARKKVAAGQLRPNKDKMLSYLKVESLGVGRYAGFAVDGDHLFCLADGTVTHNSHTFCRMLLQRAAEKPLRILCARELQISIRDSVHRLLSDLVSAMGLDDKFEVGQSFLRGKNGSDFIFKGLRHNAAEIKSTEGIDIAFVEEASAVSDDSWKLLIPTIRAPGSEIWAVFNPDQESDPVYRRFVLDPPDNAIVRRVNYDDNPWFPPELEAERAYLARVDPDAYAHVWLGECRTHTEAQVLGGKWCVDLFEPADDWDGPYYGADWGFAQDPSTLVKCWIKERVLYVEHEAWGVEVSLDNTPELFDRVPGARAAIVYADCARPETINHLRERGYAGMTAAKKWSGSVEDGVEFLRSFEKIVIHDRCKHAIEEARLWSYKTDRLTGDVLPALKPGNDHCIAAGQLVLTSRGDVPIEQVVAGDRVMTRAGWRPVVRAWQASPSREVWAVKSGGKTLIATPDHEVYTVGRGFVRVDALRYNDDLLIYQAKPSWIKKTFKLNWLLTPGKLIGAIQKATTALTKITSGGPEVTTSQNICTSGCTATITAKFSPDFTSIMSMAIQVTTNLKTWFASPLGSICALTGRQSDAQIMCAAPPGRQNDSQKTKSTAPGYDPLPRRGTPAKKGEPCTGRLVRWAIKTLSLSPSNANTADVISKHGNQGTKTFFAAMPVSQHGAEQAGSMTKHGFASFAARISSPTNTQKFGLVPCPVEAISSLPTKEAVYDLAVFGCHEFMANGVLVSNCWDAIRYACGPLIRNRKSALYLHEDTMNPDQERLAALLPGVDRDLLRQVADTTEGTCGRCTAFKDGQCLERDYRVGANDPGCVLYVGRQ